MIPKLMFVYGTLKSGYGNNRLLSSSKLVGKAVTKEKFLLVDCGFPYMIPERYLTEEEKGTTRPVEGEVWAVSSEDTLDALDRLEGVDHGHYQHEQIDVEGDEGDFSVTAYTPCDDSGKFLRACPTKEVNSKEVFSWG